MLPAVKRTSLIFALTAAVFACGATSATPQSAPGTSSTSTPTSVAAIAEPSSATATADTKPCGVTARAAEDAKACDELGMQYLAGRDVEKDDAAARGLFERSCNGGVVDGCANLAFMLEHGRGGAPDAARAVALNTQACGKDNATACFNLAAALEWGKAGLTKDLARALQLYQKACSLKLPPACEAAGRL